MAIWHFSAQVGHEFLCFSSKTDEEVSYPQRSLTSNFDRTLFGRAGGKCKVWQLDKDRLYVSYFGGDPKEPDIKPDLEAKNYWMQ